MSKPLYTITIDVYPDRIETWSQRRELTTEQQKQFWNLLTRVWDLVEKKQSKQLMLLADGNTDDRPLRRTLQQQNINQQIQ